MIYNNNEFCTANLSLKLVFDVLKKTVNRQVLQSGHRSSSKTVKNREKVKLYYTQLTKSNYSLRQVASGLEYGKCNAVKLFLKTGKMEGGGSFEQFF